MDKWMAVNLTLSVASVLLALVGIWLTNRSMRAMAQARRVRLLSETLVAMWQIRQSVLVSLAYNYALMRQPRLTELRGRALEELLLGHSNFTEQKERFGGEARESALKIVKAIESAEGALRSGAYREATVYLNEAAKIIAEEIGKVRRALDDALRGET